MLDEKKKHDQGRTVKKTDAALWRRLKAQAAILGRTIGDCLNEAIREWLEKREK